MEVKRLGRLPFSYRVQFALAIANRIFVESLSHPRLLQRLVNPLLALFNFRPRLDRRPRCFDTAKHRHDVGAAHAQAPADLERRQFAAAPAADCALARAEQLGRFAW